MPVIDVQRTYLEMTDPAELRGLRELDPRYRIERPEPCPIELYRKLYERVGEPHHWRDRLAWSDAELRAYLVQCEIGVWILFWHSEAAGYFELRRHEDQSVEIVYFGLRPEFVGKGLGKPLLTRAVDEAWRAGAKRVWLHTCTLDSPHALPNYLARGFREFKREIYQADIPDTRVVIPQE